MLKDDKTKNILLFVMGSMLCFLALFFLTGAASHAPTGKYELGLVTRSGAIQMYVMDTSTGAVKWVDSMNTPFAELKGD